MEQFLQELKTLIQNFEAKVVSAWDLLIAFIKEAIKEEEAALWPQVKAQAEAAFNDQLKMSGLSTVQERVTVIVADVMVDLVADGITAKQTLINAYVWAVAHQTGQIDGNQGVVTGSAAGS